MVRLQITRRLAATALAAALAAVAAPSMAQPGPGAAPAAEQAQRPDRGERPRHRQLTPEQREQYVARRAEAFKQKLQLTPEQEPAWNSLLQSLKPEAGARQARLDLQGLDQLTTPERIDRLRALRAQHAAEADRRGDAIKAFYATLTPAQQKTFDAEGARLYGPHGHHWGGHEHGHGVHRGPGPAAAK